jgi:hypothetical protein
MDPHAHDFAFLKQSVLRLLAKLRERVERADSQEAPRQLCAYIHTCLKAVEEKVDQLDKDFSAAADDSERVAVNQELRLLNAIARGLHVATPWLESVEKPTLELGMGYFLEEAAAALLKTDVELIMNPHEEYMYSTLGLESPFSQLLSVLGESLPTGAVPIVINYPALEPESVLLHSVFIHELGHDAVERFALRDATYKKHPKLNELNQNFAKAVKEFVAAGNKMGQPISEPEAGVKLRKWLNNWIEEILCDLLALGYVGPSFLFAATAFLLPVSRQQPSKTHPPAALRMQVTLDAVEAFGWKPLLDARLPETMEWLKDESNRTPQVPLPPYLEFIRDAMVGLAKPMREAVSEHLDTLLYKSSDFDVVADRFSEMFKEGILLAQLEGEPTDRRGVLLAGWLHLLADRGDEPSNVVAATEDLQSQQFITRSLEMSFVLQKWMGA